ncbi:ribosomal protein S6 kinase-like 1 (predicted), isoform CRA_a [Rattus norvegicus]|uniref:Ribosomal protein S6 kinase-like 1 (Predicted), isoform CRA_a n=1 Tax=Rattus norvegicus TaxID=10116 RepID=A6JE08_RAT|nr:ribosomal protein S6 kinase-like 1 (predicted), isoform CRA_a [Rattus norvegicus]
MGYEGCEVELPGRGSEQGDPITAEADGGLMKWREGRVWPGLVFFLTLSLLLWPRRHPLVTSTLPGPLSTLGAQVWLCPGEVQSPTQHWPQPYDPSKAPTRPHLEAGQNPSGASVDFPEPSPSPPASERG